MKIPSLPLWMETKYPILKETILKGSFFIVFPQYRKIIPISMRISHHRKRKEEKCVAHMWQKMFTLKKRENHFCQFLVQIIPSLLDGMWKISITWGAIEHDLIMKKGIYHIIYQHWSELCSYFAKTWVNFPTNDAQQVMIKYMISC